MSAIMTVWNEENIRFIIRNLDRKTGLNGASLPIQFSVSGRPLGYYYYTEPKRFCFNRNFFNDPHTKEAQVVDVIRHEYAHYYVDAADLAKYVGHSAHQTSHGADWKWACKMVGAIPMSRHNFAFFYNKNWDFEEAWSAYNAEDIAKLDILAFLGRWNQLPVDEETANQITARIKEHIPNAYCEIGDKVLHPEKGFGFVQDAIVYGHHSQKVYVRFEDHSDGVFDATQLSKITNSAAYTQQR